MVEALALGALWTTEISSTSGKNLDYLLRWMMYEHITRTGGQIKTHSELDDLASRFQSLTDDALLLMGWLKLPLAGGETVRLRPVSELVTPSEDPVLKTQVTVCSDPDERFARTRTGILFSLESIESSMLGIRHDARSRTTMGSDEGNCVSLTSLCSSLRRSVTCFVGASKSSEKQLNLAHLRQEIGSMSRRWMGHEGILTDCQSSIGKQRPTNCIMMLQNVCMGRCSIQRRF